MKREMINEYKKDAKFSLFLGISGIVMIASSIPFYFLYGMKQAEQPPTVMIIAAVAIALLATLIQFDKTATYKNVLIPYLEKLPESGLKKKWETESGVGLIKVMGDKYYLPDTDGYGHIKAQEIFRTEMEALKRGKTPANISRRIIELDAKENGDGR